MNVPLDLILELEGARTEISSTPLPRLQLVVKRCLDEILASLLLVLTGPLLLGAILWIRLTSRGPALFVQPRIGHDCRVFPMYKLRTMVLGAEALEERLAEDEQRQGKIFLKVPRDPRVTRLGRLLRRTSIDELPQLLNVLRGDMSLVGPRPILLSDFRKFPRGRQLRRFSMRPGLTGLWQVSGRSLTTDDERMALDLEYVERWSLSRDLAILARTPKAVLSGRGAT